MSGVPSWVRVGAKCVCIKRGPWRATDGYDAIVPTPSFGEICTITDAVFSSGEWWLLLAEYSDLEPDGQVPQWSLSRFRPVVPPKSQSEDVALFAKHLTSREVQDA